MSKYTPITIKGSIVSYSGKELYSESDGTGMSNKYRTYDVEIGSLVAQLTGDGSTRESQLYNGIDVEEGMWIADSSGETIMRIISISNKNELGFTCVVEDFDMLSMRLNNSNTISTQSDVIVFSTNQEGEAIIVDSSNFLQGAIDKIQSRLSLNERDDRVKFYHTSAPSVEEGDIVTIDSSGNIVLAGDVTQATDIKVGTVIERLRSGKDVYIKPFNDIIQNYKEPESLTGNPGQIYYLDPNNPGEITTVQNNNAVYLQLSESVPTDILGTNSNLPGAGDTIELNGIKVFDGPGGDSVASTADLVNLINGFTAQTNITSSEFAQPGSTTSNDNTLAYTGFGLPDDVTVFVQSTGSPSAAPPEITLGDGNSVTNIQFNSPDGAAFGFDTMSASATLLAIQAGIASASLDLVATSISLSTGGGQGIKIETTGSATGIQITNVQNDAAGTALAGPGSVLGLNTSTGVGLPFLRLLRNSGGPINITGSPISGGFINQGGMVSSTNGIVPYLLLIENIGTGTNTVGIATDDDLDQVPNVTSSDGDATGIFITHTPFGDSLVQVTVNGLAAGIGDGTKTASCYFSADGGTTARAMADIEGGDQLYWNGSIAGYELDGGDLIDVIYDKPSA